MATKVQSNSNVNKAKALLKEGDGFVGQRVHGKTPKEKASSLKEILSAQEKELFVCRG